MNQWTNASQGIMNIAAGTGVVRVVLSVTPPYDSEEPLFEGNGSHCTIDWPTLVHQCAYHDARIQWSLMSIA